MRSTAPRSAPIPRSLLLLEKFHLAGGRHEEARVSKERSYVTPINRGEDVGLGPPFDAFIQGQDPRRFEGQQRPQIYGKQSLVGGLDMSCPSLNRSDQ
jgi:hypothetical protein